MDGYIASSPQLTVLHGSAVLLFTCEYAHARKMGREREAWFVLVWSGSAQLGSSQPLRLTERVSARSRERLEDN